MHLIWIRCSGSSAHHLLLSHGILVLLTLLSRVLPVMKLTIIATSADHVTLHGSAYGTVVLGSVVASLTICLVHLLFQILVFHDQTSIFTLQFDDHIMLVLQPLLQRPFLFHALSAAILRVASILQRPSLLLYLNDLILAETIQSLVQLTDGQLNEGGVVDVWVLPVLAHSSAVVVRAAVLAMMTQSATSTG